MSHRNTLSKTKVAPAKRAKKAAKTEEGCLGFDPRRDQAGDGPRPAQTAQGDNDRRDHEGDRLAATLGPRLLCRRRAQEARLDVNVGEDRRRTRLPCDGGKVDQVQVATRPLPRHRPPSHDQCK